MAYVPEPVPQQSEEIAGYLQRELLRISAEFAMIEEGRYLPVLGAAPKKPREGMLAVADGVGWNPGSGKGLYEYKSGSWSKL